MGVGRCGVCPTELQVGSTLHIVFNFTNTIAIEFALFLLFFFYFVGVKESSDSLLRCEHCFILIKLFFL